MLLIIDITSKDPFPTQFNIKIDGYPNLLGESNKQGSEDKPSLEKVPQLFLDLNTVTTIESGYRIKIERIDLTRFIDGSISQLSDDDYLKEGKFLQDFCSHNVMSQDNILLFNQAVSAWGVETERTSILIYLKINSPEIMYQTLKIYLQKISKKILSNQYLKTCLL